MTKRNSLWSVLTSIVLFLVIDQLLENWGWFNLLNLIYHHTGISQSVTQFLFKVGELVIVLLLNRLITKQPFYQQRTFTKWDYVFWIILIVMFVARLRTVAPSDILPSIMVGLAGGVPEEFMVRGVIMGKLLQNFTRSRATYGRILGGVVIADIIFGLLHLNNIGQYPLSYVLTQVGVVFGSGLIFSALYIRTGSIWYAVAWHFMNDFVIQAGGDSGSSTGALDFATAREFVLLYLVIGIIGYLIILPPFSKKTPTLIKKMKERKPIK